MRTCAAGWAFLYCLAPCLWGLPKPADWVPARWPWSAEPSLELLSGTPVNCLLLEKPGVALAKRAAALGVVALLVVHPDADAAAEARQALAGGMTGVVLEGEFPPDAAARAREAAPAAVVIELTTRARMPVGRDDGVIGTFQGVWPGVQVQADGAVKAAPTGSAWVDTNTGFLRAVRASGNATVWLANRPPARTVIPAERYEQAIADAAMSGGRWVLALDDSLAARLEKREPTALKTWVAMARQLRFYESHPEWRAMRAAGKLAVVQDAAAGSLLSGGILDMIAARHTPMRPVAPARLTPEALAGATMAVNVDAGALTPEQRETLRNFARAGGTLLTPPPGWKAPVASGGRITLEKEELSRLNEIWRDVQQMVGRRNLGVRLFNVSSMLSNLLVSPDGKQMVVHLVNYSGYPVENVAVHFLGKFTRATLLTPGDGEEKLGIYPTEEGGGVDIARVPVSAALRLE